MDEQSEMRLIPTGLVNNLINYLQGQPYGSVYQLIAALTKLPPSKTGGMSGVLVPPKVVEDKKAS